MFEIDAVFTLLINAVTALTRMQSAPPLLTPGTAEGGGHPFVHDQQGPVQAGPLHGHLDLLHSGVQGSLAGLLSGEQGVPAGEQLGGRQTHGRRSRGKACGGERMAEWKGTFQRADGSIICSY